MLAKQQTHGIYTNNKKKLINLNIIVIMEMTRYMNLTAILEQLNFET